MTGLLSGVTSAAGGSSGGATAGLGGLLAPVTTLLGSVASVGK
ncbi:hypothetical protein ACNHE5_22755 [Pandoraea pnomenusa]